MEIEEIIPPHGLRPKEKADPHEELNKQLAERTLREAKKAESQALLAEVKAQSLEKIMELHKREDEWEIMKNRRAVGQVSAQDIPIRDDWDDSLTENDVKIADAIAKMEPARQAAIIGVLKSWKDRRTPNDATYLLPYLAGINAPQAQGAGIKEIVESMVSLMRLAKEMEGQNKQPDPQAMMALAFEKVKELYSSAGGGQTPTDAITTTVETLKKLKELGLIPENTAPGASYEIEKLRLENARAMGEMAMKNRLELAKIGLDKQRVDAIGDSLVKVARAAGQAMGEGMEGEEAGKEGESKPLRMAAKMVCPQPGCGNQIVIPQPDVPRALKCSKCGSTLDYKPKD